MDMLQKLKLELITKGITVSQRVYEQMRDGSSDRPLTLHDYASTSGITLILGKNIWANVPIYDYNPNIVKKTLFKLDVQDDDFILIGSDHQLKVRLVPVPSYYSDVNSSGEKYISYAITHTDRVRISPIEGCAFNCSFCDLQSKYKYRKKSIEGLVNSIKHALDDPGLPAKHILISGGTPTSDDYSYLNNVYESVAKNFPSVPIDIMIAPIPGLFKPTFLKEIGINEISLNMELFNEDLAKKFMPKKGSISRNEWLKSIEKAVRIFGAGKVRSLLMVGLESMQDTVKGVEALSKRGCEPVLSPFRPDPATTLSGETPPNSEFLRQVYEESVEVVAKEGMKLGPKCIPCQHNTITFPDNSGYYFEH